MTTSGSPSRAWILSVAAPAAVLAASAMLGLQPESTQKPAPAPETQPATPAAAPKEPVETELILRDGRKVSGELVSQSDESVVLLIGGVATTFKMDVIEHVNKLPSVDERYEQIRPTIDPEDVGGLMRLADWLRAHNRFEFALTEINRALKVEPGNPDARALKTLIVEQQKIAAQGVVPNQPRNRILPGPAVPKPAEFPLLTKEQINIMRVYEVDLKDPPRMLIERKTITQFLDKYGGKAVGGKGVVPNNQAGRALFLQMKPADILDWMFALKAREFYGEVTVQDNPRSLQTFRDSIHRTWLVNSCATASCHGGEDAGRLWLYTKKSASDASAFTNFLIMERFKLADGRPLINYNEPAQSPLLQMGLPRDEAVIKHPELVGANKGKWHAVFRGPQDERFVQTVEWIKSMYPNRPDYPVDYRAPVPTPKVAPAAPQAVPEGEGKPGDR